MANVSSVTKHFITAKEGFITTLASTISSAAVTVPLNSVSGYTNGDVVALVVDPGDPLKKQVFTGTVDTAGVQITGVVWTEGTDQSHTAGAAVVDYETATAWAAYAKGIKVEHSQAGVHALTSNSTLTSSKFITAINDTNGNELLKLTATASAVNEFTLANGATGNAPEFAATGSDTDIDAKFTPKGTGRVKKGSNNIDAWQELGRTTLGSAGDTISVTPITAMKYLKVEVWVPNSGSTDTLIRFNGDSSNIYSTRYSANGGADTSNTSASSIIATTAENSQKYVEFSLINTAANEKLIFGHALSFGSAGATATPTRWEFTGKWTNTSAQIIRVDIINAQVGADFAIGAECIVYGHN